MKKPIYLSCFIILCFAFGCTPEKQNSTLPAQIGCDEVEKQIFPERIDQISKLEEEALAGSNASALGLAHWYFNARDEIKNEYWTTIAAENGSVVGKHNLGMIYVRKEPTKLNKIRARYWLLEAIKCGSESSEVELKDMDEKDQRP
jgi:TPR repeat protein